MATRFLHGWLQLWPCWKSPPAPSLHVPLSDPVRSPSERRFHSVDPRLLVAGPTCAGHLRRRRFHLHHRCHRPSCPSLGGEQVARALTVAARPVPCLRSAAAYSHPGCVRSTVSRAPASNAARRMAVPGSSTNYFLSSIGGAGHRHEHCPRPPLRSGRGVAGGTAVRARIVVPINLCPVSQAPNAQSPSLGLSCRASGRAAGHAHPPAAVPASFHSCSPAYRPGPLCSRPG